jgi:diaminohydroxyphosphoribosylaminopyrimidine deaminase/5-amino-6-(5-phosphoribosylamino)uracil reductase
MEERRTSYFVGTKTVIDDNPKLDVRDWTGGNPVRIVLDQNSRLQKKKNECNQIKTIVLQKRQLIPTKKTLPLLSSILKKT